jgi:hypothetical protein
MRWQRDRLTPHPATLVGKVPQSVQGKNPRILEGNLILEFHFSAC